jgi:hypothetical protein
VQAIIGQLAKATKQPTPGVRVSTMARHLEQQASEAPTLLIHHESVFLIVYSGGFCGEFLSWWLGLHPGCIRTQVKGLENNRYVWQQTYQYAYHSQGTKDKLFLSTHPGNTISKCGFAVPNAKQHIWLYSSARYQIFFFYMFLIKTLFFKYSIHDSNPPRYFTSEQWQEFLKYLDGRQDFYNHEAESWINQRNVTVGDLVIEKWNTLSDTSLSNIDTKIDVGQLFFENSQTGSEKLCAALDVENDSRLAHYLPEYHQRNVALVEKYHGTTVDQFLNLTTDQALSAMIDCVNSKLLVNKI